MSKTKWLTRMAMLTALSILLVYLIHPSIFPSAEYLRYDMADVPILIGTFMFGPASGLLLTAAVSVLQWLLVSPEGGWVGAVMHFLATGMFAVAAGAIYRRFHTKKGALLGLGTGAVAMVLAMIPLNYIFTVHFYGVPKAVVDSMLLPVIIPFNVIKAFANAALTFLLYKSVAKLLKLEAHKEKAEQE